MATFLGETAASEDLPAVASLPGFVPVLDNKAAGANVVLNPLTTENAVIVAEVSVEEIKAAQETSELEDDSFADEVGRLAAAAAMTVDDDEDMSDISEAPEVMEQVTLQTVMRKLNTMEKRFKHSEKRSREKTRVIISQAVDPLKNTVHDVQSSVIELQKSAVISDNRIGALESQMAKLNVGGKKFNPNDVAHLRVSFVGFSGTDLDARLATIKGFMEKNFGDAEPYACIDTRTSGPFNDIKPTGESFVQFFTRSSRDRVLKQINDGKLANGLKSSKGNVLTVGRYRTDWQRSRDWAMRKSEELIKKKLAANHVNAKVEYKTGKDDRKILVNNSVAFLQSRSDAHGVFLGDFDELKLE